MARGRQRLRDPDNAGGADRPIPAREAIAEAERDAGAQGNMLITGIQSEIVVAALEAGIARRHQAICKPRRPLKEPTGLRPALLSPTDRTA